MKTREPLPAIAPNTHQPLQPVEELTEARASLSAQLQREYPYAPQDFEREQEAFGAEQMGNGGGDVEGGAFAENPDPQFTAPETTDPAERQELLEGQQFADRDVDPEQIAPGAETQGPYQQVAFITVCESFPFA